MEIVDTLVAKHLFDEACIAGLLTWFTSVHTHCWSLLTRDVDNTDWTADAELMDLVLARLPSQLLAVSALLPAAINHCVLSVRLPRARFTASPQYLISVLAASRMYTQATDALLLYQCAPAGMRAGASGGIILLRRFLRDLVRGDGVPRGVSATEWVPCPKLAHCALRMLEVDALGAPLVDLTAVFSTAPYL
jgi:hypothetical protein